MEYHKLFDKILYLGPDMKETGGMSSVVKTYCQFAGPYFHFICTYKDGSILLKLINLLQSLFLINYYCVFRNINIVHIHTASNRSFFKNTIFLMISKLYRKKVILHIHGGAFEEYYQRHKKFCSHICSHADYLIAVSKYFKTFFEKHHLNHHIDVLYNAVDISENIHKRHTNHFELTFMGAININKGVYDILRCVSKHKDYFVNMKVNICGLGETDNLLKYIKTNKLEDIVYYHGWVSGNKKALILAGTTIYLQPSYYESLGISIIEAMSYSIPIVASNVGGIPDLVQNGVNGFLINPGDDESLFQSIKIILDNEVLLRNMGQKSYEKSKRFIPAQIKMDAVNLYLRIMS